MSQFNLDLSYYFKGMENKSPSIQSVLRAANNVGMTFSKEFAGDVFNALYQKNPHIGADDNSQYSQAIRAALQSPRFQHLRMQTIGSIHWSSVAASLITKTLADELEWNEKEKPPETPKPPKNEEGEEKEPKKEPGDNPQPNKDGDIDDPEGEESEEEGEDSGESEEDSEDGNEEGNEGESGSNEGEGGFPGQPTNKEGDNGKDKEQSDSNNNSEESDESDDESGNGGQEHSEDNDSGNESDESSEEGENGESDSNNDSDNGDGEDSDNQDDSDSEEPGDSPNEPTKPADQSVKDAIDKASKEMSEMLGGIRAGSSDSMFSSAETSGLAEMYTALGKNPELMKIIQFIGRMNVNQQFLKGLSYAENVTPVSINHGNDVPNVLPRDLVNLTGDKNQFAIFAQKYTDRTLLQRKFDAPTHAGKGPMILCIDESGSMGYAKRFWAESLAVAMYFQCMKDRRQFAVIKFSTTAKLLPLPKSTHKMDPEFMEQLTMHQYTGGGTHFDPPWNEAIKIVKSDKTWQRADIVFLTDGQGYSNRAQWELDKKQTKCRLISFFIDGSGYMQKYVADYFRDIIEVSDAFVYLDDLSEKGEKAAFNVLRNKDAKGFIEVMGKKNHPTTANIGRGRRRGR